MDRSDKTWRFGIVDYVVFGCITFVSLLLGIFFAIRDKRHNTAANYFLGNKKQKALPLGISYVVTFMSSIIFLGTPAEIYLYGIQYVTQLLGVYLGFVLSAVIVVPLYHPLAVTSCYEYYYLRYGSHLVRYLGVTLGTMFYILYMGVVLNGAALALKSTAGLPPWMTIVIFSLVSVTYTSLGGIKAVIWTDVFQSVIMLAGIITVLIKILTRIGGMQGLANVGGDRLKLVDFDFDPTVRHTFWTLSLGAIPHFFYPAITQAGVQRILSTSTITTAKRMIYIAAPVFCIAWLFSMFEGISVFAYFKLKRCDPIASEQIENPNQIIPFVMLELFHTYPGIPGLFIAALAAASLSTISSGLSGLAAVVAMDILRVLRPGIDDSTVTNISKLFVIIIGLISVAVAFILSNVKGPLGQIMNGFTGAVAGPETGMFLVSVFFRRSRPKAVVVATILVLIFSMWLILGQTFSPGIKQTQYLPLSSTDQCSASGNSTSAVDTDFTINVTSPYRVDYTVTSTPKTSSFPSSTAFTVTNQNKKSVLETMYSISYMYIHLIGTLLTIILAAIGSLLTQPKQPEVVNEQCCLSLNILIPAILRRQKTPAVSQANRHTDTCETETML